MSEQPNESRNSSRRSSEDDERREDDYSDEDQLHLGGQKNGNYVPDEHANINKTKNIKINPQMIQNTPIYNEEQKKVNSSSLVQSNLFSYENNGSPGSNNSNQIPQSLKNSNKGQQINFHNIDNNTEMSQNQEQNVSIQQKTNLENIVINPPIKYKNNSNNQNNDINFDMNGNSGQNNIVFQNKYINSSKINNNNNNEMMKYNYKKNGNISNNNQIQNNNFGKGGNNQLNLEKENNHNSKKNEEELLNEFSIFKDENKPVPEHNQTTLNSNQSKENSFNGNLLNNQSNNINITQNNQDNFSNFNKNLENHMKDNNNNYGSKNINLSDNFQNNAYNNNNILSNINNKETNNNLMNSNINHNNMNNQKNKPYDNNNNINNQNIISGKNILNKSNKSQNNDPMAIRNNNMINNNNIATNHSNYNNFNNNLMNNSNNKYINNNINNENNIIGNSKNIMPSQSNQYLMNNFNGNNIMNNSKNIIGNQNNNIFNSNVSNNNNKNNNNLPKAENNNIPNTNNLPHNNSINTNNNNFQNNQIQNMALPKANNHFSDLTQAPKTGLSLLGDTSYLNSVLQIIGNFNCLANYFLNPKHREYIEENIKILPLTFVIYRLFLHLYVKNDKREIYRPEAILYMLGQLNCIYKSKNNSRRNPNELLSFILNQIHSETNKIKNNVQVNNLNISNKNNVINVGKQIFMKNYKSKISDNFNWFEIKEIKCTICNNNYYFFNTYNMLELDILFAYKYFKAPITIYDCLKFFELPKTFNSFCQNCKAQKKVIKFSKIYSSPNIFIISLDRKNLDSSLLQIPFIINDAIDISNFVEENCPKHYILTGIISYFPKTKSYVSFCISPVDNKWYLYYNENVELKNINEIIYLHNKQQQYIPCALVYNSQNI